MYEPHHIDINQLTFIYQMPFMEAIQRAQILKEELDSLRPISKEKELRIMQKFRLDWNYHSNNLEGNSLTYGETKALILFGITAQGKPFKDHLEMTGHNEAVEWIEEIVKEDKPLTQAFIRELHTLLLKEPYQVVGITPTGEPTKKWVVVGDYKKTPNQVKTKTGEMFWFATPEETPAKMTDLIDWFRSEKDKEEYDAIVTAIQFHYRFIRIHPFDDSNGRTARILMNFILMQGGYPPVIIKTGEKEQYIAALEQADVGLFEPFINYISENLCKSLELIIQGAKGESVEEEDDIDKEIKLLELKLQNVGRKIEKTKSPVAINEFSELVLKKAYECFMKVVGPFNKYFKHIEFYVPDSKSSSILIIFSPKEDVVTKALKILNERRRVNFFELSALLKGLRYTGFEKENILLSLRANFQEDFVILKTVNFSKQILYTDMLNDTDLLELERAIKKDAVAKIDAKIQEKKDK